MRLPGYASVSVPDMIAIRKKIVVDERGKPQAVLIPRAQFCEMCEALGLDLDAPAKADLRATRRDLKNRNTSAFKPLAACCADAKAGG